MFGADFVPSTDDAALEQAKCALDGIGVDVAIKVLFSLWLTVLWSQRTPASCSKG